VRNKGIFLRDRFGNTKLAKPDFGIHPCVSFPKNTFCWIQFDTLPNYFSSNCCSSEYCYYYYPYEEHICLQPSLYKLHSVQVCTNNKYGYCPIYFTTLWIFLNEQINVAYSYNKSQWDALFLNFILVKKSKCFGQICCPSSGVLILYSHLLLWIQY